MGVMEGIMRSKDMTYLQVLVPTEAAHAFVSEVGTRGVMEFADLNKEVQAYQRRFMPQIVRIGEMERMTTVLEEYLSKYHISYDAHIIPEDLEHRQPADVLDRLEEAIGRAYSLVKADSQIDEQLSNDYAEAREFEQVLHHLDAFLGEENTAREMLARRASESGLPEQAAAPLLRAADARRPNIGFNHLAGVLPEMKRRSLERQIFLASRGNTFCVFRDLDHGKQAFVVFFLGERLRGKLRRLCQLMDVRVYVDSLEQEDLGQKLDEMRARQRDVGVTVRRTRSGIRRVLREVATQVKDWRVALLQEKSVYHTLNRFKDSTRSHMFVAEGWVPTDERPQVENALRSVIPGDETHQAPVVIHELPRGDGSSPPTTFATDDFLSVFQRIVDTYGVPRYGETNPALFSIVSFPFMYGMMYGDVVHGAWVLLVGLALILVAPRFKGRRVPDSLQSLLPLRYLLLLMGLAAVFMGLVYNDALSLPMAMFDSAYTFTKVGDGADAHFEVERKIGSDGTPQVYAFGLDHAWYHTETHMVFFNSLKMKMSIVMGTAQMLFGLFLSLSNYVANKDKVSILLQFIPELIFLVAFNGFLCFGIFYKWTQEHIGGVRELPSLITVIVSVFLNMGTVDSDEVLADPNATKLGNRLLKNHAAQESLHSIVLALMLIAIPWLLLGKPVFLWWKNKRQNTGFRHSSLGVDEDSWDESAEGVGHLLVEQEHDADHEHGEFSFGSEMTHQMIHTMEYVLGTISNTASYLRLWALSLAHAQLSEVFFEQLVFNIGFGSGDGGSW
ncbi:MAG: hypothetical protein MHM6MM_005295, partial [Cercozoa sp. M6MM]